MSVGETRTVINKLGRKNCRTVLKKEYYITKRETVLSGNMDGLKYQFLASQNAPVDERNPTGPSGDPSISVPGNPNEFESTIAYVFCEHSMVTGLTNVRRKAQDCGIEEILVELCFEDDQVNGLSTKLDYKRVFKEDDGKTAQRRELAEGHCLEFVGVKLPTNRKRFTGNWDSYLAKSIDHYLSGAFRAMFRDVFVKADLIECGQFSWEVLRNDDKKRPDRIFLENLLKNGKTIGLLYFCRAR